MVYHYLARIPRLLQSTCLLCHCPQQHGGTPSCFFGLCSYCQADLPFIGNACQQCSIPLPAAQILCGNCISTSPAFDSCCCAVTYEKDIQILVRHFKATHNNAIGRLLCELLLSTVSTKSLRPDLVIPAPMHWQRNLQRGNNHAALLAKILCRQLQLPLHTDLIRCVQSKPVQKQLNAQQRKQNLARAFQCSPAVKGLRIAIVDDVITTGSTMHALAKTLKQAGASEVHGWAIARTPKY